MPYYGDEVTEEEAPAGDMIMPFGKHKGLKLGEMPKDYLEWMSKNLDLRQPLKTAVAAVLNET